MWKDEVFRKRIDTSYPGYLNQHDVSAPGAKIYITAQPLFFDLTTLWSENLQRWWPRKSVSMRPRCHGAEMDKKLVEAASAQTSLIDRGASFS